MTFKTGVTILGALIWKEIYFTFSNRNIVILSIVTPVVLSILLGAAVGNVSGGNVSIALVNLDQGRFGQLFAAALMPDSETLLQTCELGESEQAPVSFTTTLVNDPDAARRDVEIGKFTGAIIIPADFSQKVGYTLTHRTVEPVQVEVYANSGNAIGAAVVRAAAETLTNAIITGNIAIAATFESMEDSTQLNDDFMQKLACAFHPSYSVIRLEQQYSTDGSAELDLFAYMSGGQAVFFLLFIALHGATDLLNERRQGTLQRLMVAPIPRAFILAGKLGGTFINCLIQLTVLYIALSVVNFVIKSTL